MNKLFLFFTTLSFSFMLSSQNIKSHQWENRVLLIFANDANGFDYQDQLTMFQNENEELKDRKLIIYKISGNNYQKGMNSKRWLPVNIDISEYRSTNNPFEVVLVGLDGEVKFFQNSPIQPKKLYANIDGMPMRKRELKSKN